MVLGIKFTTYTGYEFRLGQNTCLVKLGWLNSVRGHTQKQIFTQVWRSWWEQWFANDYIFGINSSLGIQFLERHRFMRKFKEILKNFFNLLANYS